MNPKKMADIIISFTVKGNLKGIESLVVIIVS